MSFKISNFLLNLCVYYSSSAVWWPSWWRISELKTRTTTVHRRPTVTRQFHPLLRPARNPSIPSTRSTMTTLIRSSNPITTRSSNLTIRSPADGDVQQCSSHRSTDGSRISIRSNPTNRMNIIIDDLPPPRHRKRWSNQFLITIPIPMNRMRFTDELLRNPAVRRQLLPGPGPGIIIRMSPTRISTDDFWRLIANSRWVSLFFPFTFRKRHTKKKNKKATRFRRHF